MSSQFFLWDQSEKFFFFACPMLKIFDTMPFAFDEWLTFHSFRRTVKFTALLYNLQLYYIISLRKMQYPSFISP